MWGMSDALDLVRSIQPVLHSKHWHVSLGGGVLNKGVSAKDLDLYFHPFDDDGAKTAIMPLLEALWGQAIRLGDDAYPPSAHYSQKVKFSLPSGKRIDAFINR